MELFQIAVVFLRQRHHLDADEGEEGFASTHVIDLNWDLLLYYFGGFFNFWLFFSIERSFSLLVSGGVLVLLGLRLRLLLLTLGLHDAEPRLAHLVAQVLHRAVALLQNVALLFLVQFVSCGFHLFVFGCGVAFFRGRSQLLMVQQIKYCGQLSAAFHLSLGRAQILNVGGLFASLADVVEGVDATLLAFGV